MTTRLCGLSVGSSISLIHVVTVRCLQLVSNNMGAIQSLPCCAMMRLVRAWLFPVILPKTLLPRDAQPFFLVIISFFNATQIALIVTPKCAARSRNDASGKSRTCVAMLAKFKLLPGTLQYGVFLVNGWEASDQPRSCSQGALRRFTSSLSRGVLRPILPRAASRATRPGRAGRKSAPHWA